MKEAEQFNALMKELYMSTLEGRRAIEFFRLEIKLAEMYSQLGKAYIENHYPEKAHWKRKGEIK